MLNSNFIKTALSLKNMKKNSYSLSLVNPKQPRVRLKYLIQESNNTFRTDQRKLIQKDYRIYTPKILC